MKDCRPDKYYSGFILSHPSNLVMFFIKYTLPFLSCAFVCLTLTRAKQPNILLIVSDDMGWNDIGYVDSKIKTPNLDCLASEGVKFERFYANPICSVTRAALMSGRATLVTGVSNRRGLPLHYPIMSESFQKAGYATWMVGKWHLGGSRNNHFSTADYLPHNRGFDHFYGHLNGALHYINHTVGGPDGAPDWWRNGEGVEEEGFQTELLTDEAIELIEKNDSEVPFFLYLAYHAPHVPLSEPPSGMETYSDVKDENQKLIYANTTFMDSEIGRLIDVLEERGDLENTLVWFFNDNGGSTRLGSSNLPLKGQKGSVDEGGIRVRAFARWPKLLKPSVRSQQFMWVGDMYPTLAAVAGIELPGSLKLDGVDLWDPIKNQEEVARPEFVIGNSDIAVFRPPWKLVIPADGKQPELFQVVSDPYEKRSVAAENPALMNELSATGQDMIAIAEVSPVTNAEEQVRRRPGGAGGGGPRAGTGPRGGQQGAGRPDGEPERGNGSGGRGDRIGGN